MGALRTSKPSPLPSMPQPVALHERHDAVDVGIVVEDAGAVDLLGDEAGDEAEQFTEVRMPM
jgi:hypothetical protein